MKAAIAYGLVLLVYAVFSYSLTDPNLVITTWSPYWQFQQWMWQTFFLNRQLLTISYISIVGALFICYLWLVQVVRQQKTIHHPLLKYALLLSPLLLAYNALSHDVFNYMFNAKMVWLYQADPHVKVALDFAGDEWLRFMHNTHTPAPYGYGWTVISLIPSWLGGQKFITTWLLFRFFSLLSLGLLAGCYQLYLYFHHRPIPWSQLAIVFLNPLVVIEVVGNQHNDLWMMAPAVASLVMLATAKRGLAWVWLSLVLLGLSVSIKLASIALIPIWLALVIANWWPQRWSNEPLSVVKTYWPVFASVLMFIPLLTLRSQQFHPWYLTWVLVWLPLFPRITTNSSIINKGIQVWSGVIVALSLTSLLRYVPWLWAGGFAGTVLWQQKLVTWVPPVVLILIYLLLKKAIKKSLA